MPPLPDSLYQTYLNTCYTILDPPICIRIGESNPSLAALLEKYGTTTWAYITAWNPGSQPLPASENDRRQQELLEALADYPIFEGEGIGEDNSWPPEKSLLVLGITEEKAIHIGHHFAQNAIITGSIHGVPELRILTD